LFSSKRESGAYSVLICYRNTDADHSKDRAADCRSYLKFRRSEDESGPADI